MTLRFFCIKMGENRKIKFNILSLGCKVNQYDAAVLANFLSVNGFVKAKKDLDLIIVNSCAVTKTAISKSRRLLLNLKKQNPQAISILLGCWPKIYQIKNSNFDYIFPEKDIMLVARKIKKIFFTNEKEVLSKDLNIISDRSRYFIKVQDGCEQFCSYCIIPLARGKLKSRPSQEIIAEIKAVIESGIEEIVLSGIHLGLYAKDFAKKDENLFFLLKEILKLKGNFRLRLSSIEINEVSDEIIDLIAKDKRMCRHLHIPLQSGHDKILKLMNRPYNVAYFAKRIEEIRKKIPDIAISTDVIVGFPGESEADFQATFNLCAALKFSKIHVFSFSAHEKAAAFHFPDKVSSIEIKDRSERLRTLSKKQEKDFKAMILSQAKDLDLLLESLSDGKVRAKSQYYFDLWLDPLVVPLAQKNIGKIIKYKL